MDQIEKNKAELHEMIERIAHEPLSQHSICNLDTLCGAYKALCLVGGEEHTEEQAEPVKTHSKAPQTA